MREYYSRLLREWRGQVFIFWKAQIGASFAAGIITAIVNEIRQQSSLQVAVWSIGIAVIGYLVIFALFSICALMCAPVKLDQKRSDEIQDLDRRRVSEIGERDTTIQGQVARIIALETKATRTPSEQHHYDKAKEVIEQLSEDVKQVIRAIYSHDGLVGGSIPEIEGVDPERVRKILNFELTRVPFITRDMVSSVGAAFQFKWQIVVGYKAALEELLYPAQVLDRPVTPKQS